MNKYRVLETLDGFEIQLNTGIRILADGSKGYFPSEVYWQDAWTTIDRKETLKEAKKVIKKLRVLCWGIVHE